MKKIMLFCFALILPLGLMAQVLPLDFEVPEDDAFVPFNGATSFVVEDPTDATNQVLELVSNGVDFDGATITMATYIDLSDDTNNTITFEMWAADASTRTHLLQLKGGTGASPQTQLYFDTTEAGWQTITLNFSNAGPTLSNDYLLMDLFADAGPGNTATGTYYIDDIDGPNGEAVPIDALPATPASVPNYPNAEVYSIYNDSNDYSTVFPFAYEFGAVASEPDLDDTGLENLAYKFNFGIQGFGQGVEPGDDIDVTAFNFVTFDYWAGSGLNGFNVVMINEGVEYTYRVGVDEAIETETWVKVEIPMTYFTNLGFNDAAFFQWKMGPLNNSIENAGFAYIDNILLTENPATLSNNSFSKAEFKAYPNPTQDVWNIRTSENIQTVQIYNITGRLVKEVNVNASEAVINTNELSSGVYLAKISNEFDQTRTIKLIKK
jgi:hypothetical protein